MTDQVPEQASGSNPFKGLNHKEMDKYFVQLRKEIATARRKARHTLSPGQIRLAIKSGEIPPNMEVLIGQKADGSPFTTDDLRNFQKARRRTENAFVKGAVGAPVAQLMAASAAIDVERANEEIKAARLYRVRGNMLTFNVTASQKYDAQWHHVRVRLEHWHHALISSKTPQTAVRNAVQGPVSFDCDCGRHQFWYRYLATAGGFCLTPLEKDFPKVRNPTLTGCCCKHVLKVLQALGSPTVQAVLARELARQADRAGFANESRTQFLTKKEQAFIEKARPRKIEQSKIAANWARMKSAQKSFLDQLEGDDSKKSLRKATQKQRAQFRHRAKELERQAKALEKREKALAKRESQLKKDSERVARLAAKRHNAKKAVASKKPASRSKMLKELKGQLEFAKMYQMPVKTIYAKFADINKLSVADVKKMAEEL